jgi:hypothetical protein
MPKRPRNVLAKPLMIAAMATLVLTGITALLDLWPALGWFVIAMTLLSLLLGIAYTIVAIRNGWIATVGHLGQIHHVQRREEPIFFWILAVFYLVVALPAAWYLFGAVITPA